MKREKFFKLVEEALDALRAKFRKRIQNVSVLFEDLPAGFDWIVLYQENIEAVCSNGAEIRQELHLTVVHELGHYFGMSEAQWEDV